MSDIKDLHDWNDNREDGFHLNISKPFGQLNEIEIRDLLEKIVERQNFTIDKILDLNKQQKETIVILKNIMSKQTKGERTSDALVKLANSMAQQMDQQWKIVQDLLNR